MSQDSACEYLLDMLLRCRLVIAGIRFDWTNVRGGMEFVILRNRFTTGDLFEVGGTFPMLESLLGSSAEWTIGGSGGGNNRHWEN